MLRLNDYDLIIFDCDGVLFDTNTAKVAAMGDALQQCGVATADVQRCQAYFAANFGKSRYHHVRHFITQLLTPLSSVTTAAELEENILMTYAAACRRLYIVEPLVPGAEKLLSTLTVPACVASGSDQAELRTAFEARGMASWFDGIYGSPTPKQEIVQRLLEHYKTSKAIMIGDALSDLEAARSSNIDFLFFSPFSLVQEAMRQQQQQHGFLECTDYSDLTCY